MSIAFSSKKQQMLKNDYEEKKNRFHNCQNPPIKVFHQQKIMEFLTVHMI